MGIQPKAYDRPSTTNSLAQFVSSVKRSSLSFVGRSSSVLKPDQHKRLESELSNFSLLADLLNENQNGYSHKEDVNGRPSSSSLQTSVNSIPAKNLVHIRQVRLNGHKSDTYEQLMKGGLTSPSPTSLNNFQLHEPPSSTIVPELPTPPPTVLSTTSSASSSPVKEMNGTYVLDVTASGEPDESVKSPTRMATANAKQPVYKNIASVVRQLSMIVQRNTHVSPMDAKLAVPNIQDSNSPSHDLSSPDIFMMDDRIIPPRQLPKIARNPSPNIKPMPEEDEEAEGDPDRIDVVSPTSKTARILQRRSSFSQLEHWVKAWQNFNGPENRRLLPDSANGVHVLDGVENR